jgi:hypothetical protein
MKNYCVKKYSVEQLDRGQTILTNYINNIKRAKISLNHYIERIEECENMLKLNEEMRKNLSEWAYLRNKDVYEGDICDFKKIATRLEVEIENIEKEMEEVREKYCL